MFKISKRYSTLFLLLIILLILFFATKRKNNESFARRVSKTPSTMREIPLNNNLINLLETYKPRVFVADKSYRPMDFYRDYLPNTVLLNGRGDLLSKHPTRDDLIAYKDSDSYSLNLTLPYNLFSDGTLIPKPTIYGRGYEDVIDGTSYIFLKYNLVFPYSGLPAKVTKLQRFLLKFLGTPNAWHQLDIHGAFHIILRKSDLKAVGILINHHNHHKSYILGRDYILPHDNRAEVAIAMYSNEPYLAIDSYKERYIRTSGNPSNIPYLSYRSEDVPFNSAFDYIPPISKMVDVPLKLVTLPSNDPLYTSFMSLGKVKKIPFIGRVGFQSGPPGMDYYAPPSLKDLGKLFSFWYIDPDDDEFFNALEKDDLEHWDIKNSLEYQEKHMGTLLKNI